MIDRAKQNICLALITLYCGIEVYKFMSTILIFVRHGESEGNKSDSFNGSIDVPLTDIGVKQAERTAKFLDRFKIDAIYSSDLKRAYETALYTAKRKNLTIVKSSNLREINGGEFEGIKYIDIEKKYPKEYAMWKNDMANCKCPNGESVRELAKRVNDEIMQIAKKHKGHTVMIATHGTPLKAMSAIWYKKDIKYIRDFNWAKNASVTVVNYDDLQNPVVVMYDEHEHLQDLLTELSPYV